MTKQKQIRRAKALARFFVFFPETFQHLVDLGVKTGTYLEYAKRKEQERAALQRNS